MQNGENVHTPSKTLVHLVKERLLKNRTPVMGLVLGTGLGAVAEAVQDRVVISYKDMPGFPHSTAPGHEGRFVAGVLGGVPVLVQQGRCHIYEGRSPAEVAFGVRLMASLGVQGVILTNAAGSINPLFPAGSLMLVDDHMNLTGLSPLIGPNDADLGPRFPDMSQVYDSDFAAILERTARELGLALYKGVYVFVRGPQFETRAETRAYRSLGGDAVGMSTVLEVVAARHAGLRVAAVSGLSNQNLPDCMAPGCIEEVLACAAQYGPDMEKLIVSALPAMAEVCK